MATNTNTSLLPEIGPDGLPREASIIAYTEKVIADEQLQLKKYIEENYTKIRDVERELGNLSMEMKLTSGPKKAALEHMRKKIEVATERIRIAKLKEDEAKKAWEAAAKVVKEEEAVKQKLCEDLNNLVQESSNSQFSRLEELKRRLEALNPNRPSMNSSTNNSTPDHPSIPHTPPLAGTVNTSNQGNSETAAVANGHNQQLSADVEGRGKKKVQIQGRMKGVGAVPKARGSPAAGWTGAGFDVDGRT